MLTPLTAPPKDYYQNNCITLFETVLAQYGFLLEAQEQTALQHYLRASNDAQRLMARLLGRKGPYFRASSLDYDELADRDGAIDELATAGLVAINPLMPADALLGLINKPELIDIFPQLDKRLSKSQMMLMLLDQRADVQISTQIYAHTEVVAILEPAVWRKALYIYFGAARQDWSTFVRRDLGQIEFEQVPLSAQFDSQKLFAEDQRLRRMSELSHRLDEQTQLATDLMRQLRKEPEDRWLRRRRNRTLLRVARHLERQQALPEAASCYALVQAHPARERRVRVLTRLRQERTAQQLLADIRETPLNEEELQFAERFGKRNAGYQPTVLTHVIADTLDATEIETSIEATALKLLIKQGLADWGCHVENALVRTLTGLMYWPVIFLPLPGAFTNPFQAAPNDLYHEDFSAARSAQISELEQHLADDDCLRRHLLSMACSKAGIANELVSWSLLDTLPLSQVLEVMPLADIRRLSRFMLHNLSERRSGLPDLFVAEPDGGYRLIEVKGPGDQLQPGQRVWLKHLHQLQIPSCVLRLK